MLEFSGKSRSIYSTLRNDKMRKPKYLGEMGKGRFKNVAGVERN